MSLGSTVTSNYTTGAESNSALSHSMQLSRTASMATSAAAPATAAVNRTATAGSVNAAQAANNSNTAESLINEAEWLSLPDILSFCFPVSCQHPLSRGRLIVLSLCGPLVHQHSYLSCLCSGCQAAVRDRRKTDPFAAKVFKGQHFNAAHVKKHKTTYSADSNSSDAQSRTVHLGDTITTAGGSNILTVHSGTARALSSAGAQIMQHTGSTPYVPPLPVHNAAIHSNNNYYSNTFTAARTATAGSALNATHSLTNAEPASESLSYLCRRCRDHVLQCTHIRGGYKGHTIVTDRQIDEMAKLCAQEDLLTAYQVSHHHCQYTQQPDGVRTACNGMQASLLFSFEVCWCIVMMLCACVYL